MNVININLALSGCCPLKANCYQETGNVTNYYPGDCPKYAQCQAVLATLIAFDNADEDEHDQTGSLIKGMEPELREKLISLKRVHPNLFEAINLPSVEEREEILRDGESALIEIEGKSYRFGLDEVSEYVGDGIYDL